MLLTVQKYVTLQ